MRARATSAGLRREMTSFRRFAPNMVRRRMARTPLRRAVLYAARINPATTQVPLCSACPCICLHSLILYSFLHHGITQTRPHLALQPLGCQSGVLPSCSSCGLRQEDLGWPCGPSHGGTQGWIINTCIGLQGTVNQESISCGTTS